MTIVEFIGPPGSGKSTLISELLQDTDVDLQQPSPEQYFISDASKKITVPYQFASGILPNQIRKLIKSHYRRESLHNFIKRNPQFFNNCGSYIKNTKRPEHFMRFFLWGAERRQLANMFASDGSKIVLDENLCHYGAHMFTEYQSDPSFSDIEEFCRSFTSPDVIVHVDLPSDEGVKRQRQRGGIHSFVNHVPKESRNPVEAQDRFSKMCELVIENVNSEVIQVDNTESVRKTSSQIINRLDW